MAGDRVDLNADVGEGLGPWPMGDDATLIPLVTSVNVACGAHAGDPLTIERTVRLAASHGVAVGAHPGYPDLVGFGRRDLDMAPAELEASIVYQVAAVAAFAADAGVRCGTSSRTARSTTRRPGIAPSRPSSPGRSRGCRRRSCSSGSRARR